MIEQICTALQAVRSERPLVHCITNYVTVNDVANILLALGASPIMADDEAEVAEITSMASALVLNIGTLNARTIPAMIQAGQCANQKGIPVILDPVGAGASTLRRETTKRILAEVNVSIVRGNLSEIAFVAGLNSAVKGVDVGEEQHEAQEVAKLAAQKIQGIAAITGAVDVISDGSRLVCLQNGHPMLARVTGTGCMSTALVAAYAAQTDALTAAVGGILSMGIAGELAYQATGAIGTGRFHLALIDAISRLDKDTLRERARLTCR